MPDPGDVDRAAAAVVDAAREAEPSITRLVRGALDGTAARLAGFDERLKTVASTRGKIARLARRPGVTPADIGQALDDTIRYRAVAAPDDYAAAVRDTTEALQASGANLTSWSDRWNDSRYKGINSVWELHGRRFEVQFHTPRSADVASEAATRHAYETARDSTGRERSRATAELKRIWRDVPTPPGQRPVP